VCIWGAPVVAQRTTLANVLCCEFALCKSTPLWFSVFLAALGGQRFCWAPHERGFVRSLRALVQWVRIGMAWGGPSVAVSLWAGPSAGAFLAAFLLVLVSLGSRPPLAGWFGV